MRRVTVTEAADEGWRPALLCTTESTQIRMSLYETINSSNVTSTTEDSSTSLFQYGLAVTKNPEVTWDDVVGLTEVKEKLTESVIIPLRYPQLNKTAEIPWKGILLFGAPGTGKTFLSKAIISQIQGCVLYRVSWFDFFSPYIPDGVSAVRDMFTKARMTQPSIIIIDDFELEGSDDMEHQKRIKTEILVQTQGIGEYDCQLAVLLVTHSPWDLGRAEWRRLQSRIYFPLPDLSSRKELILHSLSTSGCLHQVTADNIDELAALCNGFTPADIVVLIRDSMMQPIRKLQNATHFRLCSEQSCDTTELMEPCDADAPGAVQMSLLELESNQLKTPIVTIEDLKNSLSEMKASVDPEYLRRIQSYNNSSSLPESKDSSLSTNGT